MDDAAGRDGEALRGTGEPAGPVRAAAGEADAARLALVADAAAVLAAGGDLAERLETVAGLVRERLGAASCDVLDGDDAGCDGATASLRAPLSYAGRRVGLLVVGARRDARPWLAEDERTVGAVADQIALAVAGAREVPSDIAARDVDGLTGLMGDRDFARHLRHEVAAARRYGHELSLAVVDLDDFAAFNERHGPRCGDRALAEVADVMRRGTRADIDVLTREGAAFVIILPAARADGPEPTAARNVSERLRGAIAGLRLEDETGERALTLSASIGVAGLGLGGYTAEELRSCAGKALYLAKRQGKDRVVVFAT